MAAAAALSSGRWRRRVKLILAVPAAVALLWAAGFVWFVHRIEQPAPLPPNADGIVVLTGGAERVEVALRLLAAGRARKLLVSGTGGGADLAALARRAGLDPGPLSDRVTLGRHAMSTHGNALETQAWVQRHTIHSLIVVTAYYHMPRALAELQRSLPEVRLYPYPVLSPAGIGPGRFVTTRLLVEEYTKYLAAAVGLTAFSPKRDALQDGHTG